MANRHEILEQCAGFIDDSKRAIVISPRRFGIVSATTTAVYSARADEPFDGYREPGNTGNLQGRLF